MAIQMRNAGGMMSSCGCSSHPTAASSSTDSSWFGDRLVWRFRCRERCDSKSPALGCSAVVWWSDARRQLLPDWEKLHAVRVKTLGKMQQSSDASQVVPERQASMVELIPSIFWDDAKSAVSRSFGRDMIVVRAAFLSFLVTMSADVESASDIIQEMIVGRTAMLGFLAALNTEIESGSSVSQQVAARGEVSMLLVGAVVLVVSLIQQSRGQGEKEMSQGPFTVRAERLNGQAAMLGFALLLVIESAKGSALF